MITLDPGVGTRAARSEDNHFSKRTITMQSIQPAELDVVVGGTTKATNDQITQALTTLQTSIKDIASANTNGGGNNTFMLMAMMMMMRPQPTVVAGGGGPPMVAGPPPAPGAVINIRTRLRHW
jgi:hypothetical protein